MFKDVEEFIGRKMLAERIRIARNQGIQYSTVNPGKGKGLLYVYFDGNGIIRNFSGGAAYVTKQDPDNPDRIIQVYEEYEPDIEFLRKWLSENTEPKSEP